MLLELKNVKKYFPVKKGLFRPSEYVKAVDHVDLVIEEGKSLGLVGESGSGKTTLGRLVVKLYPADEGAILLNGQDITRLSAGRMRPLRKQVQMVFQDPYSSLDPRFTVRSILQEADRLSAVAGEKKGREGRFIEALKSVGLGAECLERFPHEFSGGERQRIAIARALVMKPKLLILDEAVSSLDVLIQEQIIELLEELKGKYQLTYLFISHNLRVVKKVCERIAVMYKGKIVETGPTEEILRRPLHPYTRELLDAAISYRASQEPAQFFIRENSRLTDQGGGHFVID